MKKGGKMKKAIRKIMALILVLIMAIGLCACSSNEPAAPKEIEITDMIGRTVTVTPGSYTKFCAGMRV